jgi:two-component system, response regulator PdtaR
VVGRIAVASPVTMAGSQFNGLPGRYSESFPSDPPEKECSPVTQQVSEQNSADEALPGDGLRVLVVEDEALIRLDLTEMLTEEGYVVAGEAGDGEQAVELARELRPDLVIMDVKMPKMDGIAAAGSIVEEKIAPVVMLTAFSQRDLIEQARDAGAMAYLVKPFARHELVPAIELAVSRFAEKRALEDEVATLTDRLETRKVVDRAKGLLMTRQNMTEPEAFRWIQRTAMDRRTTMKAVADAVVDGLAAPKS